MASSKNSLFKVKAAYDYTSAHEEDLSFSQGQIIVVTEEEGDEWYVGEYADSAGHVQSGLFPSNFVERYEPAPPPRPVRSARPKPAEMPAASPPTTSHEITVQAISSRTPDDIANHTTASIAAPGELSQAAPPTNAGSETSVKKTTTTEQTTKEAPTVAAKSSSFRDRIAAFNKSAAPPIAPYKPSALGSSGFIKKPFVAPPPSRNAYVPPPTRDVPAQTFYRREEDPEIAERQAQDLQNAERAGLVPTTEIDDDDDDDDSSKPVSLKERIALLQRQQMEQATRRGEAATKDKPRKPTNKRAESRDRGGGDEETTFVDAGFRRSTDADEQIPAPLPPARAPTIPDHTLDEDIETEQHSGHETIEADAVAVAAEKSDTAADESTSERFEDDETLEGDGEGDEDLDDETRHQLALRQRMAKLSGGMGMPGMFGPPGGLPMMGMAGPAQRKKVQEPKNISQENQHTSTPLARPPSIPAADQQRKQSLNQRSSIDERRPLPSQQTYILERDQAPLDIASPSAGSESDDELPGTSQARDNGSVVRNAPSLPTAPPIPRRQDSLSQKQHLPEQSSIVTARVIPDASKSSASAAFQPPRVPRSMPTPDVQTSHENESEYEGDYDTDIASSAKHKDALTAHSREQSANDSDVADHVVPDSSSRGVNSPSSASRLPSRPVPPPPPPSAAARPRTSLDTNRALATRSPQQHLLSPTEDDDYDPYRYGPPVISPSRSGANSPMIMSPPAPTSIAPPPVPGSTAPPPLPSNVLPPPIPTNAPPPPVPHRSVEERSDAEEEGKEEGEDDAEDESEKIALESGPHASRENILSKEQGKRNSRAEAFGIRSARSSVDVDRTPIQRRSTDQHRLSISNEYIASDINFGESSRWWTAKHGLPPALQERNDIFHEVEESLAQKRGGKALINKDIYVLFRDYSQTVLSVRFDSKNPADVTFEQRHESPPASMRQDQLESAYSLYGAALADAANAAQNTVVGDGSSQGLILKFITALKGALPPVGTRAYGALIYSNLANATVQQFDEIRPGDIVSFRNAKFQGKHGGVMHQKYQMEAGKPDHVAIVLEWDGTKKKIRAAEQGRDSKKCKAESFRLGDLRSGEVRVWRLMNRSWVGWDAELA